MSTRRSTVLNIVTPLAALLAGGLAALDFRLAAVAAVLLLVIAIWARLVPLLVAAGAAAAIGIIPALWRAAQASPPTPGEIVAVVASIAAWMLFTGAVLLLRRRSLWWLPVALPIAALMMFDTRVRAERVLDGVERTSHYLVMRDGVKIAVDVYLPRGAAGQRLPTIVEQTRYHRSMVFRWPASLLLDVPRPDIRRFVEAGYGYVFVDARGSGASFGSRQQEWSPEEIEDGGQVVDWIVRQPWSSGSVGATGISYNCTAAELLASTGRAALRAVAPRFCMFDVYTDIVFPGGVPHDWFGRTWGGFNGALDRNALGDFLGGASRFLIAGVRPVDNDPDGGLLRAAVAEHAANYYVSRVTENRVYRDDAGVLGRTLDAFSTFPKADRIRASGIPIYLWSGWFDAANQRAAISKFLTYGNPGSRLIIGPWDHGARQNVSPFNRQEALFDQTGELIRFFDHHLKGAENGFDREPPVRFFVMGAEQWRTAPGWPVQARTLNLHLRAGRRLTPETPGMAEAPDRYDVNLTAGSGRTSRWLSAVNIRQVRIGYPDRAAQDRKLLTYDTAPLAADTEVIGHPVVTLHLASTRTDADVFVYLEEVAPDGAVTYVTEGSLRARHHRERASSEAPYRRPGPYHSYMRRDGQLLTPGQPSELRFDLLPTAYRFRAGHRIRIAIAGADRDHARPSGAARWEIWHDPVHTSRLEFPIAS